jgi:thymidine phosphorylase
MRDLRRGLFFRSWAAHGLRYRLPLSIVNDLRAGHNVIANGSRAAIPEISPDKGRLVVIEITAPRAVLRERILSRGRETSEEVEQRVGRAVPPLPNDLEVVQVVNDSTVEEGAERLVSALERYASRFAIRKLPISSASSHVAYIPEDSCIVAAKAYADVGRIDVTAKGASVRAAVNIVGSGMLGQDQLGLSREAFEALGLPENTLVSIQRTPSPTSLWSAGAFAQEANGVPGSPSATKTITGRQLPPPVSRWEIDLCFGGHQLGCRN